MSSVIVLVDQPPRARSSSVREIEKQPEEISGLPYLVLGPLEEAESQQVLDVASALPAGPNIARKDGAAGSGHIRVGEGGHE